MSVQALSVLRILLDRRITSVPMRVLRKLRAKGKRRFNARLLSSVRSWLDGELLSRHDGRWVLNSFLPPFPSPAFDRMFENLLSGRRLSPVSAYLGVCAQCPYDCWHCSLKGRRSGELPKETWLSAIRQLHGLGASIIGFTGGEPLSRADLPELVEAASRGGAAAVVFTSGACMDGGKAAALGRAGLWGFCVSLDHPDPAECGRLRGSREAYGRAIEALRMAKAAGFYTMIGAVATRTLVDGRLYEGLYAVARAEGVHELRLIEPMPCGRLSQGRDDALLGPERVARLRAFHVETNRRRRLPKVCAFNQIESPEIFGCGAGTQHLFIDSAGEVCPCDFTPLGFGNIRSEPLAVSWERMNAAMGNPRRDCFIQKHHELIARHAEGGYPLPLERSLRVCEQAGHEPLPDYFKAILGG